VRIGGHDCVFHIELRRGRVGLDSWYAWMETSFDLRGRRRRWDLLRVWEVCGVATMAGPLGRVGRGVGAAEGVAEGEDVCIARLVGLWRVCWERAGRDGRVQPHMIRVGLETKSDQSNIAQKQD